MSEISARFNQSPNEKLRYVLDYTLDLDPGEVVTGLTANVQTVTSPALVCNGIVIGPDGTKVVYYISGGQDATSVEVQFLATTSLSKIIEDVVEYDIGVKV